MSQVSQQVDRITSLEGALARSETAFFRAVYRKDFTAANRLSWEKRRLWDEIDALRKQAAN